MVILHDLNLATLFAERVVVLDRGGVARDGPAGETITDDMLAQVFGIAAGVGRLPAPGVPCAGDPQVVPNPVVTLCDFCNALGLFRQGHTAARFFCSDVADLLQGKGVSS